KTPVLLAQGLGWLSAGALVLLQVAGRFDLVSLAAIAAIILACGVVPVARPSKMIEEGAKLSFSLFITHAITGLVWFGVTDILTAQLDLPVAVQWVLWGLSVPAALLFAGLFHVLVDGPLQAWIARRLKARRPAASQLPA
ncbi:MAG: acyltransferase, partial [Caulobacteraceae bacterium]|nr:acyltransferase [Caulobacteraceae bacterium]